MTAHTRAHAHAEFMRIWEEGYVATTATFDAMHMQGVAILDGAPLRGADGSLDRSAIVRWVEDATRGIPYARLRLMRSPLGVTPPAWVPDASYDVKHHVRFDEGDVALSTTTLPRLIGWDAGPLTLTRPLWRVTFTTLADGRVAMGLLMHHSGGDALRTLSFLSALTVSKPDAAPKSAADPFADARAPRVGGGLALQALAQWRAEHDDLGSALRAWARRPLLRRARRTAARILRPVRNRRRGHRPPATHSAFRTIAAGVVQDHARAANASMNEMIVASVLRVAAGGDPVEVRVPVLRRRTEESRNRISDVLIRSIPTLSIADVAVDVRRQLKAAKEDAGASRPIDVPPAREIGYATLVPWLSRPRYLKGARIEDLIVLPAALPDDELSMFAILYADKITVTATAPLTSDVERTVERLVQELAG